MDEIALYISCTQSFSTLLVIDRQQPWFAPTSRAALEHTVRAAIEYVCPHCQECYSITAVRHA